MRINRGRSGSKLKAASLAEVAGVMPPALLDRMNRAETDVDPIPAIDCDNQKRELHLLLVAELSFERLIDVVGSASLRQQGQGLGPGERGALTVAVERRIAPGVEQVKT